MADTSTAVEQRSGDQGTRRRELTVFWFLAVVLMPIVAVAVVGGYGFAVWMYQLFTGPPAGPG